MMLMQIKNSNDSLHSSLVRKPLGTLSLPFFLVKLILDSDTCREFFLKKYCCEIHDVSMTSTAACSLKKCAWGGGEERVTRDLI